MRRRNIVGFNRIAVLASIVLAMLVASMDMTIINTTMPVIAEQLGGFQLYAWTFAAYMIFSTVVAPIAGRLSDLFGRKKVFGAGILLFLFGSLLCGASTSMLQLVIFRAVQGFGAGVMLPFPAIIAGDLFTIEKRGKIQALMSGMWGISAIIAPMLGAFFVEFSSWRWIFYVNIPISILAFLLLLPYKEVYNPKKSPIDYVGATVFAAGVSLLLLTTVVASYHIWYILAGTGLMVFFFLYERRHKSPIVPLGLFRNKAVAWMIVNAFLACTALFGASSYIPLFLQKQGYGVFISGVALLGMSLGWMAVSVPAGKWIVRYGYRPPLIAGNLFLVLAGSSLLFLRQDTGFWYVTGAMTLLGVAFGLIVTVTIIGAQQLVDSHQKGISTSLQMFGRNIGTAIGVTVMGAFLIKAPDFITGIFQLFLFGFIVSIAALATVFFIKDLAPQGEVQ
jgi:MFS family permease